MRYEVFCTKKNVQYDRIVRLGCECNGIKVSLSESEVIARLRGGDTFFVEQPSGHVAELEVVEHATPPFVKTKPDGEKPNNLLSLPHCKEEKIPVATPPLIVPSRSHGAVTC